MTDVGSANTVATRSKPDSVDSRRSYAVTAPPPPPDRFPMEPHEPPERARSFETDASTDVARAERPMPRNLSLIRLEEADRRVRRRLVVTRGHLQHAGLETRIAEGSAIAAEIALADENLRRRAIRANLLLREASIAAAAETLLRRGFRRVVSSSRDGSATVELLKRAARDRRAAVHVVFDEELAPTGSLRDRVTAPPRLHPGSVEAARERALRLARYRLEPAISLERRWSHDAIRGRLEEILEIGLVVDRFDSA